MFKNFKLKAISICSAAAIMLSAVITVFPVAAEAPKLAPADWFTDNFEHGNELKALYDTVYKDNEEKMSVGIGTEDDESSNKVLRIVKNDTIPGTGGDVNITLYPQQADGSYAFVGEDDGNGSIVPKAGKNYNYIVEYRYKLVSTGGAYGIYTSVGVSEKDSMALKNSYTTYTHTATLNTSAIGEWGVFNLYAPTNEWQTVSMPAIYKSGDGFNAPVIVLNFKIAKVFKGEILIDDICIKRVADGDTTSTVIINPNYNTTERFNPITYVTGAEYKLPVLTRKGYEFVGWYADKEYSELCENALPENKVNNRYTILYARWTDSTLTDSFDQNNAGERYMTGGFSIEKNAGINGTDALKLMRTESGEAVTIPRDLKGRLYTFDAKKGESYNYTAELWYKAESTLPADGVTLMFDIVESGTQNSLAGTQGEIKISAELGNADGAYHKASVALRFVAAADKTATIALRAFCASGAELFIDDLNVQEMTRDFGSFKFVGDEDTGYYAPIAGEYGDKTGIKTPDRDGYDFVGWADKDGKIISAASFGNSDYVLYPKWEKFTAPEGTTLIASDNFDKYGADRTATGSTVIGPDASSWATDDFERYATEEFKASDYTDFDFSKDDKYTISVDTEENGNRYLHIVNKGGNNSGINHTLWFRDTNGDIAAKFHQDSRTLSGKFVITYKFRYKINSATEGSFGLYLKSSAVRADDKSFDQVNVFGLTKNYKPIDIGTWGEYYGLGDGNWHTASISTVHNVTTSGRNKDYYPGFVFDIAKRSVDICLDDMSIDVKYYSKSAGDKTALNFRFKTDYKDADNKTVKGPDIDIVSANYGEKANLPTPIVKGKVFEGWYYEGKKIDAENISIERPKNGGITLEAKYRDPAADDPITNTFDVKLVSGNGTGSTAALGVSSSSAGNGLINLIDSTTGSAPVKTLAENEKINWIVRFRYKSSAAVNGGVGIDFDLTKPGTVKSLSAENGTTLNVSLTASDGNWHMVSLPVSLTRNALDLDSDVTLFIKLTSAAAVGGIYFDEFEIYDAGNNALSFVKFEGKKYVAPIAGLVGNTISLPDTPDPDYSIGGWYKDEKLTELFGKANEKITLGNDVLTLYGEYLTPDGFYAVERFDRTTEIYEKQMTSRGGGYQTIWDTYGLAGKMRSFQITDETCHDADGKGKCLKYDIDGVNDTYSSILLTNNVDEQIYLGNKEDEEEALYLVSFWYKVDRADTNIKISVSGSNYNCMWETNSFGCDSVDIPVMYKTDGWQKMNLYLQVSWRMGSAGENAKDIYALFTVSGQGLLYFDDFEYTKVNTGRAESIYFDTDGAAFIAPYTGKEGETIPALPTLKKEGYKFEGWYTDYAYEHKFDRTTFGNDGINYLLAYFTEDEIPASDDTGDNNITNDSENDDDADIDISYQPTPIYEDVTEEYQVVNYRTKTVITKTKIPGNGGFAWYWIVIIAASAVIIVGGAVVAVIVVKRRKALKGAVTK